MALKIRKLRIAVALTQTQFAMLIGPTASVISRLENADYEGHSLAMLRRIAGAMQSPGRVAKTDDLPDPGQGKTITPLIDMWPRSSDRPTPASFRPGACLSQNVVPS
jgi:transcriptional regulator with XRE-family HTH domain